MRHIAFVSAILLGTTSLPALALDFGGGLSLEGWVEWERTFSDYPFNIGYGEVDLVYLPAAGGLGGFVGFDGFYTSGYDRTAPYAALSYSFGAHTLQLGAPRAALDDYVRTIVTGGNRELYLDRGDKAASQLQGLYLFRDIDPPLGVRYDGDFGQLKLGASAHKGEGFELVGLGVNYEIGQFVLRGGAEQLESDWRDGSFVFYGAEARLEKLRAGVMISRFNAYDSTNTQIYAVYSPIERLDLSVAADRTESSGFTREHYGIAVEYTLGNGLFMDAGANFPEDADEYYNLSLGLKF
jgi:hypothetical protein